MIALLRELLAYMGARKKWWLLADRGGARRGRRPLDPGAGLGCRAFHLHGVLTDAAARHLGLLPRQRGGLDRGRPHRRGGPGGALHPQEARSGLSRASHPLLPRRRRHQSRWRRQRRLLREAAHQVRAPAGNLSRQRAAQGFRSFRLAMPLWLKEKLFQKRTSRRRCAEFTAAEPPERQAAVRRASPEPRGLALSSPRPSRRRWC